MQALDWKSAFGALSAGEGTRATPSWRRYNCGSRPGVFMNRFWVSFLVLSFLIVSTVFVCGQENAAQAAGGSAVPASDSQAQPNPAANPIPPTAPRMSKQTRFEIIRDFETQLVYTRTAFPMGAKGLKLKNGTITPHGEELRQALALWGPA